MTSAKVLVVEDDADISTVIQAALQRSGHSVVNVPDGRSAIRGLFEARPDLVILDIGLPDLDGIAVAGRMTTADRGLAVVLTSCLLYTSPSPRDRQKSRMPSSA